MIEALEGRGCVPITLSKKCVPMVYVCRCGKQRTQRYKDFIKRNCRSCKNLEFQIEQNTEPDDEEKVDETTGERWRRVRGGWISSFGNAMRCNGRPLTLCPTKYRYTLIKDNAQYVGRLVAIAFQIDKYELLLEDGQSWCVSHRDSEKKLPQPGYLENLYVRSKADIGKQNGSISHTISTFKTYEPSDLSHLQQKILPDISEKHTIYENGDIHNGKWFLQFSKTDKYLSATNINGKGKSYKVHRLVCYAFHPIDAYKCLEDYNHLQVNHIDGNTLNNHKDNLEWTDQKKNMSHAYDTGLNKKVRGVLQYEKGTETFIGEYRSIAEASRQTGEKEYNIREFAKGKPCSTRKYDWKFKNPEESEEYIRKYRSYK